MSTPTEETAEGKNREYSEESWSRADKYSKLLGAIPSSFSTAIRTLRTNNPDGAGNGFDKNSRFMADRLIKSPTLKAPVHFAACMLAPDKVTPDAPVSDAVLLNSLTPHEVASVLGMIYTYRRVKRLCEGQLWDNLAKEMHAQSDIGIRLGKCIPRIGTSVGIVLGSVRWLAMALFLSRDEKGFRAYRREVNAKNKYHDLDGEMKIWGCDHIQIASKILQTLGFGLPFAAGFSFGLTSTNHTELESDPEYYRWYCATLWIEALRKHGKAPDMTHKGAYYPLKEHLDTLGLAVREINSGGSKFNWLGKEKQDLPSAKKAQAAAAPKEKETEVLETDLPEEVIKEFAEDGEELDLE